MVSNGMAADLLLLCYAVLPCCAQVVGAGPTRGRGGLCRPFRPRAEATGSEALARAEARAGGAKER